MAVTHSGWTDVTAETADPWTDDDEEQVRQWLAEG